MNRSNSRHATVPPQLRCAIYTRKSTEEGLDKEFNSLDAQRLAGENYIASQQHEGWTCLPDRYDDGGFTGGNMERPALKRLLADIEAGKIDGVVVYKVDRLSRSLLDFARMVETFERHHVSFVSVTQLINSGTSMGRLMLNVLLSFAQFEREIISERTRDKIAAARRKGKWSGGMPLLGYDIDPLSSKLLVNQDEAERVLAIFRLYLDKRSTIGTIEELDRRGWMNKRWTTRKGNEKGGLPFCKPTLYRLLRNVTYLGKIRYKNELHNGEHQAIVDHDTWQKVQDLLDQNGRLGGAAKQNQFGAMLKGILRCASCDASMVPIHSTQRGNKRYRYYVCSKAQKRGWRTCPTKSAPAYEIERFVIDQIRGIGRDPTLLQATMEQARQIGETEIASLAIERRTLERDLHQWNKGVNVAIRQVAISDGESPAAANLADLQERIRHGECRLLEIDERVSVLQANLIDDHVVADSLRSFDELWESLAPSEQQRVMLLLLERVEYDGVTGKIAITFHATGLSVFAGDLTADPTEDCQ